MSKSVVDGLVIGFMIAGLIWMAAGLTIGAFAMITIAAVFAILSLRGK